jgi:hypothetical protein
MGNALKPASIWALRINRRSLSTGLSTFLWKVAADRATIEAPTTTRLGTAHGRTDGRKLLSLQRSSI